MSVLFLLLISLNRHHCTALPFIMRRNDVLYDMPISNHGARIRIIAKAKRIPLDIQNPATIGGLKSEGYLKINPLGKMPVLITSDDFPIIESDCIARYLLDKWSNVEPSFLPEDLLLRSLSEQISRTHDIYISPIQGCMYRAPGSIFGTFGKDRRAALNELLRQWNGIEQLLTRFEERFPSVCKQGGYLCGDSISIADATLFPTAIFCVFMMPRFLNIPIDQFMGPRLRDWYAYLSDGVAETKEVQAEMMGPLQEWEKSGRFDSIVSEVKEWN